MPGKCAFGGPVSELLATMACTQTFAEQCRSAVVYTQGLDGCSDKLVLLKSADPVPSNTFAAPTVFTMERVEGASVGAGACPAGAAVTQQQALPPERGHRWGMTGVEPSPALLCQPSLLWPNSATVQPNDGPRALTRMRLLDAMAFADWSLHLSQRGLSPGGH